MPRGLGIAQRGTSKTKSRQRSSGGSNNNNNATHMGQHQDTRGYGGYEEEDVDDYDDYSGSLGASSGSLGGSRTPGGRAPTGGTMAALQPKSFHQKVPIVGNNRNKRASEDGNGNDSRNTSIRGGFGQTKQLHSIPDALNAYGLDQGPDSLPVKRQGSSAPTKSQMRDSNRSGASNNRDFKFGSRQQQQVMQSASTTGVPRPRNSSKPVNPPPKVSAGKQPQHYIQSEEESDADDIVGNMDSDGFKYGPRDTSVKGPTSRGKAMAQVARVGYDEGDGSAVPQVKNASRAKKAGMKGMGLAKGALSSGQGASNTDGPARRVMSSKGGKGTLTKPLVKPITSTALTKRSSTSGHEGVAASQSKRRGAPAAYQVGKSPDFVTLQIPAATSFARQTLIQSLANQINILSEAFVLQLGQSLMGELDRIGNSSRAGNAAQDTDGEDEGPSDENADEDAREAGAEDSEQEDGDVALQSDPDVDAAEEEDDEEQQPEGDDQEDMYE
jgi:hypothetical protein